MTHLEPRIREYREYAKMIDELKALKTGIEDELKAAMVKAGVSKMIIGEYKLSYTDCTRKDIDKKRLQAEHSELYDEYIKETNYKRFTVV